MENSMFDVLCCHWFQKLKKTHRNFCNFVHCKSPHGITNIILDALKNDDNVKIAGFGTYKVAKRKARQGRNPRTGETIQISASQKVKFLPAKALKEMFNKQG